MPEIITLAIILIARSGAGKGTVAQWLLALALEDKRLTFKISVSDTTRPKKDTETDGKEYNFISLEEFDRRKSVGWYIETDNYAGNWYGSPKDQFFSNKALGIITIYDVEANGAEALQSFIGKDYCKIFRLDVPLDVLQKRVKIRSRDTNDEQKNRVNADRKRMAKMLKIAIPIPYGENAVPGATANEIYNLVLTG